MASGMRNLAEKEIKEMIRDPKILLSMILMPLIIFPLMGLAMNISQTALKESVKEISVAIINLDQGPLAENLITSFKMLNVTVVELEETNVSRALHEIEERQITTLMVIPEGFSENLTSGLQGKLLVYSVMKKLSFSEGVKASAIDAPLSVYEKILTYQILQEALPEMQPETVLNPINLQNFIIFRGKMIRASPQDLMRISMSQSMGFPMVIMLLLISAMQIAATSISIEKEEKTLETLLSLPVGRLSILIAKLVGSVVVALAGALAALVGVNYYTSVIFASVPSGEVSLESLGLALSPLAYLLLGVVMFITIISALALAIFIASFSDNVRSAQSLVAPFSMLIVIPSLILMMADLEALPFPVQTALLLIPYTHSIMASKAAFIGDYFTMVRSIIYLTAFTAVILYIAAKIFMTERIITARTPFERFRRKKRSAPYSL